MNPFFVFQGYAEPVSIFPTSVHMAGHSLKLRRIFGRANAVPLSWIIQTLIQKQNSTQLLSLFHVHYSTLFPVTLGSEQQQRVPTPCNMVMRPCSPDTGIQRMAQCRDQPRQCVLFVSANHRVYYGSNAASPHTIWYASSSRLCDGSRLPFVGNSRQSTTLPFGISSHDVRSRMSCLDCQLSVCQDTLLSKRLP